MSVESAARRQLMQEILNRRNLGDKKFSSESSLPKFSPDVVPEYGEEDNGNEPGQDFGAVNRLVSPSPTGSPVPMQEDQASRDAWEVRRRASSQPGPVSGSMLTATAARAARKRMPRNGGYADTGRLDQNDRPVPRLLTSYDLESPSSGRASPQPSNFRNNLDSKSLSNFRLYTPNELRGGATPRKRSVVTMDAQSIRSVETHAPPPTSPEINKKLTKTSLTISLSCTYAIFLVTMGLMVYISDGFIEQNIAPFYSLVLALIGIIYMLYLLSDITRYKSVQQRNEKTKAVYQETVDDYFRKQEMDSGNVTPSGTQTPEIQVKIPPMIPPPTLLPLSHEYCFSKGRHSGSFYLKLGAAGFALGHLVHAILLVTVQIGYYVDDNMDNEQCVDHAQLAVDIVNPLYTFLQLYFIYKYSNVMILKNQGLARFAFMHYIGTSLCFWMAAIVRETILGLTLYAQSQYANGGYNTRNVSSTQISEINDKFIDVSGLYDENCVSSVAITSIYEVFSPYLFPFSVEFNILIVAVYYIIWANIGSCNQDFNDDTMSLSDDATVCKMSSANETNDFSSNLVIYADCHASNRGLFAGLITMVFVIGMLIIGFVFSSVGDEFLELGYLLQNCTKLFLHTSMLIGVVIAYNQIRKLDINEHPISLLDDILLFICLPAFFLETVLSLVATVSIVNYILAVDFCVMIIQVVIQTALIVDGLRRCSNSRKLRRTKPGREVIMYLLIVNVAMWISYTFSYKSPESLDERYAFYGKVLWIILGHVSLPLMMFYRFHSSVCFADIWDSVYKPGSEH